MGDSGVLPYTRILIDQFTSPTRHGHPSLIYILTHFHSDHYTNLGKLFDYGTIYCSTLTANLLIKTLYVSQAFVVPLEYERVYEIPGAEDGSNIELTFYNANHCPGSVISLIKGSFGSYLHTGDWRLDLEVLNRIPRSIDILFVDLTFADPLCKFPSKEESILVLLNLLKRIGKYRSVDFNFSWMGTEELIEAVILAFNYEPIGVLSYKRYQELLHILPAYKKVLKFVPHRFLQGDKGKVPRLLIGRSSGFHCGRFSPLKCFKRRHVTKITASALWWHAQCKNADRQLIVDRFGRWRILWSMHSDFHEIQVLIDVLKPKLLIPTTTIPGMEEKKERQRVITTLLEKSRDSLIEAHQKDALIDLVSLCPTDNMLSSHGLSGRSNLSELLHVVGNCQSDDSPRKRTCLWTIRLKNRRRDTNDRKSSSDSLSDLVELDQSNRQKTVDETLE